MTPQQFRKIAMSLPGTVESEHMGHPDFRVGGKIFASLGAPDAQWGMVKLRPDQQQAFCEANAETFQPCNGAWGRQGYTNIKLAAAKTPTIRSAITLAIENVTALLPARRRAAKQSAPKSRTKAEQRVSSSTSKFADSDGVTTMLHDLIHPRFPMRLESHRPEQGLPSHTYSQDMLVRGKCARTRTSTIQVEWYTPLVSTSISIQTCQRDQFA